MKRFLGHSISCASDENVVPKRAVTMFSEGISKYVFSTFSVRFLITSIQKLKYHTVCFRALNRAVCGSMVGSLVNDELERIWRELVAFPALSV
jgi:hypothetical protein